MLLPFYFPTGRANMPRLERLILACAFAAPLYALFNLLAASHLNPETTNSPNPLFVPALAPYSAGLAAAFSLFFIPVFLGLFALINRYRAASRRERRQIRWFVWCISTIVPIFAAWIVPYVTDAATGSIYETIVLFVSTVWFYAIIPVGVGVAILRHNLYDIDIIIRKTLVYSVLTVLLATIYFGGVVLTQQLLRAVSGQSSDLAIVLSTLLIAGLFSPLRRRVQAAIDRRFYRQKYDAEQTLARFSRTLRDEVDMEALTAQLVGVVQETMQPAHVGLWLQVRTGSKTSQGDQKMR
jgi:hypothetical protein